MGFTEREIDDVNYSYGRLLLERRYREEFFAIYPQEQAIVDQSVSLHVSPTPVTVNRLWLYFVPTDKMVKLAPPHVKPVVRKGFTVVELGFLSDLEAVGSHLSPRPDGRPTLVSALPGGSVLAGVRHHPRTET